jgi:TP901 family phage tail tape measure protein
VNEFIKVALRADSSNLEKGFAAGQAAVSGFKKTLSGIRALGRQVDDTLRGIGMRAAGMSAAITATMITSGTAASGFETRMRNVNSIAKESEAQFKNTGDAVLEMSKEFPQSAAIMADGLYDLASSGFKGAEAMEVLKEANMAASAGLTETAVASKGISAVLNAYNKDASEAKDVSDILFKTVDVGVLTFEDLVQQVGDFVPLGQAAGVQFDEMAAGIAALTRSGFPAAQAATALAGTMRAFIKPSEAMQAATEDLGFENSTTMLKTLGLQGAIEKLTDHVGNNSQAVGQLFQDTEGLRGVLSLTANEGVAFTEALDAIANESNRAGASQAAFQEQSKSTAFQLKLFTGSINAARIEVGQYYLPIVSELLSRGASLVGMFSSLPGPVKAGIAAFLALAQVFTAVIGLLLVARVRTKLLQLALKDNALAMKLGIANSKSFSGMLLTISRNSAIASRASNFLAATQTRLGRTFATTRAPMTLAGTTLTALSTKMTGLSTRSNFVNTAVARVGTTVRNTGMRLMIFGTTTTTTGTKLSLFAGKLRLAGAAAGVFGRGIRMATAALPGIGTVLTMGMLIFDAFSSSAEKGKQRAQEFFDEVSQNNDVSTIQGRTKAIEELRMELDRLNEVPGAGADSFGTNVRETYENLNPFADNTISQNNAERRKQIDLTNELTEANNRAIGVINGVHAATGLSVKEIEALATALGIDLTEGLSDAEAEYVRLYKAGLITVERFKELMAIGGGVGAQLFTVANHAAEGTTQISMLGEQLAGLRSPIAGVTDDLYTLTDAQKALLSAMQDIGSPTAAWAEALTGKKDARQRAVEDEIRLLEQASEERIRAAEESGEAGQDALEDEIERIRDQKEARLDELGSGKRHAAAREQIEDETAAAIENAQDRVEAAREGTQDHLQSVRDREAEILRQQREDLQATVDSQILTLDEYTYALAVQNNELRDWAKDTITVAGRVGSQVAQYLASMGEEGVDIMHLMATGTDEEVQAMKDQIVSNMKLTGDESAVKLSAGMTVAETAAALGANATRKAIMDELGLLPEDMSLVMDAFGKEIEDGINAILEGLGQNPISLDEVISTGRSADAVSRTAPAPADLFGIGSALLNPASGLSTGVRRPTRQIMAAGGIASERDGVMFNEPGVGGEAYIPLGRQNLSRSRELWAETGKLLGILPMASGGIMGFSSGAPQSVVHSNKTEKRSYTTFSGPMYLSDAEATIKYAERKKALARMRGED